MTEASPMRRFAHPPRDTPREKTKPMRFQNQPRARDNVVVRVAFSEARMISVESEVA